MRLSHILFLLCIVSLSIQCGSSGETNNQTQLNLNKIQARHDSLVDIYEALHLAHDDVMVLHLDWEKKIEENNITDSTVLRQMAAEKEVISMHSELLEKMSASLASHEDTLDAINKGEIEKGKQMEELKRIEFEQIAINNTINTMRDDHERIFKLYELVEAAVPQSPPTY